MSIGTLRFKQLLTRSFQGDGFYVKYGSFPGLQVETQSPQHIINNILNNPGANWAQNTLVSVPTYKSDVNKIKVELPLDYISANPNFKNIVLYVFVAGNYVPYAISEPIPENMKSKNVDILSIYFTMPAEHHIKGFGSNRIALPEGINEFPLVATEGSWATKIFYEELRDSIPLGLPTGKNGVFYDDNARVTDLRVPTSGNSGGGINIGGGGSEIELSSTYKHNTRNTPAGSEDKAFTEKGAQALYGETALIEGKHWNGNRAPDTTLWSDLSPIWNKKQLTHLKALNIGIREELPAPESMADLYKRLTYNFLKNEQGVYHIIKPITKADITSNGNSDSYYKVFNFKKKDFFPDYPGNLFTYVDDLDTNNIHLPSDFHSEISGANVVDASLTLLDEYGFFQTLSGFSPLHYYPYGGDKNTDKIFGSVDVIWTKEVLHISFSSAERTSEIPVFVLPTYDNGLYTTFNDKSVVGYLTLHVAKRFFFLSDPNSIYSWDKPKIETVKFQTSFVEREVEEEVGARDVMGIKTALPYIVELVKLENPFQMSAITSTYKPHVTGNFRHVFYLNEDPGKKVLAKNTLGEYNMEVLTTKFKDEGRHQLGRNTPDKHELTWHAYDVTKAYYGIRIFVREDILNTNYDINVGILQNQKITYNENRRTSNIIGNFYNNRYIEYRFKKDSNKIKEDTPSVDGYKLITTDSYPTGIFPVGIPANIADSDFYRESEKPRLNGMSSAFTNTKFQNFNMKHGMVKIQDSSTPYYFNLNLRHEFKEPANVYIRKDVRDSHNNEVEESMVIDFGRDNNPHSNVAHQNKDSYKEIWLSPGPPQVKKIKKKVKSTNFEGVFKLIYGSATTINRNNQIKINGNIVGNIPGNVTNNGTFTVTNLVNDYRTTHPGNLKLTIGVSGETIFGNTIEGVGFSGDIILS